MKRILSVLTLVVILMMAITSVAAAKVGVGNPKGEITEIDTDAGTVTLLLKDGSTLVVTMPEGYDFENSPLAVGMIVVAKGEWLEEGFDAEWVKEAEEEDGEAPEVEEPEESEEPEEGEEAEEGEGNAWGEGGVYCAEDSPKDVHPVAQKIADKYDVDPEWVMSYACDGHGFGGVMLALQTAAANEGGDADAYLAKRKEGKGWGQIWKEDGLVKNDKADNPPPGQLKKLERMNDPDKKIPPGQLKKLDKTKPPKTNNGKKPTKTPVDESEGE